MIHYSGKGVCASYTQIADRHCDGRLVMMLEGGYSPNVPAQSTRTVLEVMAGGTPVEPGMPEMDAAVEYPRDARRQPD